MYDLPGYVWALVFAGVIAIPAITLTVLYQGAAGAGLSRRAATMIVATGGAAWACWIVASSLLARAGAYRQDPETTNPWLGITLAATVAVILMATYLSPVSRILAAPSTPARLAWPQTMRIIGGAFLIVLALGKLPAVFVLPAALGDIAIGVTAPLVARRLRRDTSRRALITAVWFNILGILDLAVAVTIGFLAGQGPNRLLDVTPTTEALGLLPLVLIPTTAVPLAVALHLASLRRLRALSRTTDAKSLMVIATQPK